MFFETYADWIDRDETKVQEQIWASMNWKWCTNGAHKLPKKIFLYISI